MSRQNRVVIVGGGFAGLAAARSLRRSPVAVTLIDRRNFHLFQPLLYQVATGGLSPADIASPLRAILARNKNTRVVQGTVSDIIPDRQCVLVDGQPEKYDFLLVATGSRHHYFGNEEWEQNAPGLKTIEDALDMRRRVLSAFELAETEEDPTRRRALLTFVVVGGGPTGVELAGALAELAHHTLRHNFRQIDPADSEILLVEGTDRLLPPYPSSLSRQAAQSLERLGVTVRTNSLVEAIDEHGVTLRAGDAVEQIAAETILWGAGVKGSSLGRLLAEKTGADIDRQGRVMVEPDLSIPNHPNIFVLGDLAHLKQDGSPLPGVAPVAMQQGAYVAKSIARRLRGRGVRPFHYKDRGSMAVIGRASAVAEIGRLKIHGYLAWLTWLFIHLINLVEFQNRLSVLLQWGWNYFTRNRSARLITFEEKPERGGHGAVSREASPTLCEAAADATRAT
jgi:NADH dehydrogenase